MRRRGTVLWMVLLITIALSASCTPSFLTPEADLWGQWTYVSDQTGNRAFTRDLSFEENGQLILLENFYLEEAQYAYVIIAPGQMKLSTDDQSTIFNYDLNGDELTLIIDGGQVKYVRMRGATPTIEESSEITITPPLSSTPTELMPSEMSTPMTLSNTKTLVVIEPSDTPKAPTPNFEDTPYVTPTPVIYFPLSNCAASQLRLGESGFVNYDGGKNSLRDTPDTHPSDNIIGYIYPGEVVEIIDGPVCNYGWVLWKVMTTRYEEGWTPETDGDEFWVLPLSSRKLCTDTLPTRLAEGDEAFVMEEFDMSNFIRQSPSLSSESISRIQPGGKMLVLEGPVCSDKSNWWKIQTLSTNIIGWTRENDAGRYFLAPIP
jgi:hypothetical protein